MWFSVGAKRKQVQKDLPLATSSPAEVSPAKAAHLERLAKSKQRIQQLRDTRKARPQIRRRRGGCGCR